MFMEMHGKLSTDLDEGPVPIPSRTESAGDAKQAAGFPLQRSSKRASSSETSCKAAGGGPPALCVAHGTPR